MCLASIKEVVEISNVTFGRNDRRFGAKQAVVQRAQLLNHFPARIGYQVAPGGFNFFLGVRYRAVHGIETLPISNNKSLTSAKTSAGAARYRIRDTPTKLRRMTHAKSLRVIGQSLEVAKLPAFELDMDGGNYVVRSDFLTKTGEWILRHELSPTDSSDQNDPRSTVNQSVRFTPVDIARLDDQAQRQSKINSSPHTQTYRRLSQLLRALGDHLDHTQVNTFHISWTSDSVSVDFRLADGQSDSRTFTAEKLEQLGSHSRFRRSSRTRLDTNLPGSLRQPRPRNR